jgi:hypothetical protein
MSQEMTISQVGTYQAQLNHYCQFGKFELIYGFVSKVRLSLVLLHLHNLYQTTYRYFFHFAIIYPSQSKSIDSLCTTNQVLKCQ